MRAYVHACVRVCLYASVWTVYAIYAYICACVHEHHLYNYLDVYRITQEGKNKTHLQNGGSFFGNTSFLGKNFLFWLKI